MYKTIFIYKDEGVGIVNAQKLWNFLRKSGAHEINWINGNELVREDWKEKASILIFPGGRDIPYHERLKGAANAQIKDFVFNGGFYLGICAGAYYASAFLEFDVGHPLEVIGSRELRFFPGVARGPAYGYGTFCYASEQGARIAQLQMSDQSILASYYNGGCYFVDAERYENVSIISKYLDLPLTPAAIVQCRVGMGFALLCGVHPEVSGLGFYASDLASQKIKIDLIKIESQRQKLLDFLIKLSLNF